MSRQLPPNAKIIDSWGGGPAPRKRRKTKRKGPKPAPPMATAGSPRMNKLEERYAKHLAADPTVVQWRFGAVRLHLGGGAWYKPDFFVQRIDGSIEFHETKGHWREAARVRIKVAASRFQFAEFFAIKSVPFHKDRFEVERIMP